MGIHDHKLEHKHAVGQSDWEWITEQKISNKLETMMEVQLGLLLVRELKLFQFLIMEQHFIRQCLDHVLILVIRLVVLDDCMSDDGQHFVIYCKLFRWTVMIEDTIIIFFCLSVLYWPSCISIRAQTNLFGDHLADIFSSSARSS